MHRDQVGAAANHLLYFLQQMGQGVLVVEVVPIRRLGQGLGEEEAEEAQAHRWRKLLVRLEEEGAEAAPPMSLRGCRPYQGLTGAKEESDLPLSSDVLAGVGVAHGHLPKHD